MMKIMCKGKNNRSSSFFVEGNESLLKDAQSVVLSFMLMLYTSDNRRYVVNSKQTYCLTLLLLLRASSKVEPKGSMAQIQWKNTVHAYETVVRFLTCCSLVKWEFMLKIMLLLMLCHSAPVVSKLHIYSFDTSACVSFPKIFIYYLFEILVYITYAKVLRTLMCCASQVVTYVRSLTKAYYLLSKERCRLSSIIIIRLVTCT